MLFLENVNYGLGKQTAATSQYLGPKNPIWLTELEEVREPKCLFLVRLLHLLNSVAMMVMLCQAFSSLSSSLRMNTDPLPAWMLNTLSMSVRRSIVYLHKTDNDWRVNLCTHAEWKCVVFPGRQTQGTVTLTERLRCVLVELTFCVVDTVKKKSLLC